MDFGLFVEFAAPEGTTDRDTFSQGFALVELAPNIESYRTAWKDAGQPHFGSQQDQVGYPWSRCGGER